MVIKKSEFITSVARAGDFLTSEKPIIAIAGKSNVGKSSFINALAGKNKLYQVGGHGIQFSLPAFYRRIKRL